MVFDAVGANDDREYGKPDGRKIRDEVVPVLKAAGIDPGASVILLFCNLMDYDSVASKTSHHSPYYGGGTHLAGTAWQCDSPILDSLRLTDPTPLLDGQYGRITIGQHSSIFISGVIHELGHALSLPHCRQRQDESRLGAALMGSGNRTYGEQLRGEGLGTFLTQAHSLRPAAHPVFNRRVTAQVYDPAETSLTEVALSRAKPTAASVGWLRPTYDRVPSGEKLLSVGGDYFGSGIYAHAPAEHAYRIGGKWRNLTGRCGVQGTFAGTVIFKIFGDGGSLWESEKVIAGSPVGYAVDGASIDQLRLIVTDAGDGASGDWGIWIEPTLVR